ncbi:MAG: 4Fe-4S binding protein [Magnetococcales bacterium]|nr:4Fe-4S binding protein [Magnetococcales bacterium]
MKRVAWLAALLLMLPLSSLAESPAVTPAPAAVMDHAHHDHGAPTPAPVVAPAPVPVMDHSQHNHAAPAPAPVMDHSQHNHAAPAPAPVMDHSQHDHAVPAPAPAVAPAPAPVMDHSQHDHAAPAPAPAPAPAVAPAPAPAPVMDHSQHNHAAPAPAPAVAPAPVPVMDHSQHNHAAPAPAPAANHADHGDHAGHAAAPAAGHEAGHGGHGAGESHNHPGLPRAYLWPMVVVMVVMLVWGLLASLPESRPAKSYNLATAPYVGGLVRFLNRSPWPLVTFKILSVAAFLLVVYAGLFGTSIPERNLATTFVWNLWWPLVVVSVFFIGSAWCGICPWDTISSWLVRHRLWRRVLPHPGYNMKVPLVLRNVWPALLMFMGLTWLQLGVGVTGIPVATALMALIMVFLSTVSLILFERKAFCRYFCPVGRTMGFYSRLAPIEVRSQNQEICTSCKTMECYNGSADIEPCPTHLTIGRFAQNTFCLSCGNCVLSCPHDNVSWRLRPPASEALADARPMWDGAWFMLALLGITSFHGVTMMPGWADWITWLSGVFGETGTPIISFTLSMLAGFFLPVGFYAVAILATRALAGPAADFKRLFVGLPFSTLPIAFVYHLSHNMDHLYRETGGMWDIFANPLGTGVAALTSAERHLRMMGGGYEPLLFHIQAGLMTLGLWLAVDILRHRARGLLVGGGSLTRWQLLPMLLFIALMTAFNLWLMTQEMTMRF